MAVSLSSFLDNRSETHVLVIGLSLLVSVAGLDHVTGVELSFSIFYLLPIVLVSWRSKRWAGRVFCCVAAGVWLFVDIISGHVYSNGLIPLWNTGVRLSFFLITSDLLVELKTRLESEKAMARSDGLTGLSNASAFKELCVHYLELAHRHKHPVSLGYIDLDNFKEVNDRYGHSEGDLVLKAVAGTLQRCVRATDVAGRLGGDEFAVFLPETDREGAQVMFGRMHEELTTMAARGGWPIGFSVGVAVFAEAPVDIDQALKKADALMYCVKKAGKNTLVYEDQVDR